MRRDSRRTYSNVALCACSTSRTTRSACRVRSVGPGSSDKARRVPPQTRPIVSPSSSPGLVGEALRPRNPSTQSQRPGPSGLGVCAHFVSANGAPTWVKGRSVQAQNPQITRDGQSGSGPLRNARPWHEPGPRRSGRSRQRGLSPCSRIANVDVSVAAVQRVEASAADPIRPTVQFRATGSRPRR